MTMYMKVEQHCASFAADGFNMVSTTNGNGFYPQSSFAGISL